jgi:hypothetical protein
LHLHLVLEAADFLRHYFSTETSRHSRGVDATDVLFIAAYRSRHLVRQEFDGPFNLPKFGCAKCGYRTMDGKRAQQVVARGTATAFHLVLPRDWHLAARTTRTGSEPMTPWVEPPILCFHPSLPRIGLVLRSATDSESSLLTVSRVVSLLYALLGLAKTVKVTQATVHACCSRVDVSLLSIATLFDCCTCRTLLRSTRIVRYRPQVITRPFTFGTDSLFVSDAGPPQASEMMHTSAFPSHKWRRCTTLIRGCTWDCFLVSIRPRRAYQRAAFDFRRR